MSELRGQGRKMCSSGIEKFGKFPNEKARKRRPRPPTPHGGGEERKNTVKIRNKVKFKEYNKCILILSGSGLQVLMWSWA